MLWQKAWLETRWRFVSGLLILTVLAAGNVYDFLATDRLLPRLNSISETPTRRHAAGMSPKIDTAATGTKVPIATPVKPNGGISAMLRTRFAIAIAETSHVSWR